MWSTWPTGASAPSLWPSYWSSSYSCGSTAGLTQNTGTAVEQILGTGAAVEQIQTQVQLLSRYRHKYSVSHTYSCGSSAGLVHTYCRCSGSGLIGIRILLTVVVSKTLKQIIIKPIFFTFTFSLKFNLLIKSDVLKIKCYNFTVNFLHIY